jgi:hypothetical protein
MVRRRPRIVRDAHSPDPALPDVLARLKQLQTLLVGLQREIQHNPAEAISETASALCPRLDQPFRFAMALA